MMTYTLRPYQQTIVNDLSKLKSCALFMGTGTGKTITAIDLYKKHPTHSLLIICPKSVITQWQTQIRIHLPELEVVVLKDSWTSEKSSEYIMSFAGRKNIALVINFESVYRIEAYNRIVNEEFTIVVDEIHRIKNWGTVKKPVKVTHGIIALGVLTPYKIALTATPTQGLYGGYVEYYPQLRFLGYTYLSYKDFWERYVRYVEKTYSTTPFPIKQIVGYRNAYEIDNLLTLMARRYVPKYEDFEPVHTKVTLPRPSSYSKMVREKVYKDVLLNSGGKSRVAKKTLTSGTVLGYSFEGERIIYEDNTHKLDWLSDFLQDTSEVVAVFYSYNVELEALKSLLESIGKTYIVINGATKDKYEELNNKTYDVVLGQFQAMSESLDGLHLKCHIEVFFSIPESSTVYKQSLGRIDRIGQTKPPMYYFLVCEGTLDDAIYKLIEEKVEYSESVLEGIEI